MNYITVSLSSCSKEWPSSHKEWVELVKKQVESHDLETERLVVMMCVTRGKWVNIVVYTFVLYVSIRLYILAHVCYVIQVLSSRYKNKGVRAPQFPLTQCIAM